MSMRIEPRAQGDHVSTETMNTADTWAQVEAMGHRSHYGRIREEQVAGKTFLRVDALRVVALDDETEGDVWTTCLYNPDSIYCLRPLTEAQVREAVTPWRPGRALELTQSYPTDDNTDDTDNDDDEDEQLWGTRS